MGAHPARSVNRIVWKTQPARAPEPSKRPENGLRPWYLDGILVS
jgi:hypothetical protein